uniref:hypothetical protein n=1 Tax=Brevundimonas sp. TaxID=1871086 RepID=UPI0025FF429C
NDIFVFTGGFGADVITDFSAGAGIGDRIRLETSWMADFADVLIHATDPAGGVVIARSGLSITLTGVTKAQLNVDDFQFVAPAAPLLETAKDAGPQVLPDDQDAKPGLFSDDDAIICPVFDGGLATDADTLEDDWTDLDPLILPPGAGPLAVQSEVTQGFLGRWMQSADPAMLQARADALDTFGGRDPHGLRWLLRERPDTRLDDGGDTSLPPEVLPAEMGPKELFDAPLICFGGGLGSDTDTVKDDWTDLDNPLILPLDIGPKAAPAGPVVCDTGAGPGDPGHPLAFVTDTETLLSERGPNRLMSQPTWVDWVW